MPLSAGELQAAMSGDASFDVDSDDEALDAAINAEDPAPKDDPPPGGPAPAADDQGADDDQGAADAKAAADRDAALLAPKPTAADDAAAAGAAGVKDAADAATPPTPEPKVTGTIPRYRYNHKAEQLRQEQAQRQAAESRVAELEAAQAAAAAPPTIQERAVALDRKIDSMEAEREQARADGDATKAAELSRQMRHAERELTSMAIPGTPDMGAASAEALDTLNVSNAIGQLEAEYPSLNADHADYDEGLSEEVMDAFDAFSATMPKAEALTRATTYVTAAHNILPVSEQKPGTRAKKGTDLARNAAAAAAQPPALAPVGKDSDQAGVNAPVDLERMSQEAFEKLGEAELDRILEGVD